MVCEVHTKEKEEDEDDDEEEEEWEEEVAKQIHWKIFTR